MPQATTGSTITDQQGRRYALGPLLGCGAQASVYAATGPQGKAVAIKLFNPSATQVAELQRAEALMHHVRRLGLQLPATVPLAIVSQPNAVGYVTELVPQARVLEEVIDAGQIGYFDGFQIVTAVWQALAQLHDAGIVHGDIHSKNVLLSPTGLSLIDMDNFVLPGVSGLPPPPFVGDLHVMAPELRRAAMAQQPAAHLVSKASDVYAANALTYLMLVGDDDNMGGVGIDALHQAKLTGEWNGDPLGRQRSTNLDPRMLPVSLMSLIRQAWHGDPAVRPTAREFAELLAQVAADGTLFACSHCGQAVFADSLRTHCPHCRAALPAPALVGPGVKLVVGQSAVTVGRHELGGDPAISSRHAVLQRLGPMLCVTDRSSFGASHRHRGRGWEPVAAAGRVVLQPGERLRLGNTEFEVVSA